MRTRYYVLTLVFVAALITVWVQYLIPALAQR